MHSELTPANSEAADLATVVWVHGVDSDSHVWDRAVELTKVMATSVAVDLPGHGASPHHDDPEAYTRSTVLAELDETITTIRAHDPGRPVILVGHSLGGYLGLAHALTRADGPTRLDGLVLVATGPGFRDPDAMASWNDRVQANAAKYTVSEVAASIAFHTDSMVIDNLASLHLPMALVVGDEDRGFLGANDYMERKLPHAHRTTVAGGRHFVMKSHPEDLVAALATVIDEATQP